MVDQVVQSGDEQDPPTKATATPDLQAAPAAEIRTRASTRTPKVLASMKVSWSRSDDDVGMASISASDELGTVIGA